MEEKLPEENIEESQDKSLEVVEQDELESQDQLEERLAEQISGRLDGFRHTILSLVVEGRYDTAVSEISYHANSEDKLNVFKSKAQRYLNHAEELIRAIESKIKFCQSRSITRSQKHELYKMVMKHFNDLTDSLKKVERIENDIRVADLKSTVWVLKAIIMSVGFLIIVGMTKEALFTMKEPLFVVTDDAIEFLFRMVGL